jgi:lysophospholipase L1-like esterase
MNNIIKILFSAALFLFVVAGCDDFTELDPPTTPQPPSTGTATFTRFVSIGNSITAGYQSGTIYKSGQMYSYGNLIAQQVQTNYQIPYVSDPGLGGRLEIASISPFGIYTNPDAGSPLNLTYPGPYNNLGVPGALTYDVLYATSSTTCASYVLSSTPTPNPYFDLILRNSSLNIGTQLQQALIQNPTFLTLWIGNNDVLGYATSGGTSPSAPTPTVSFQQLYEGICQTIAANSSAKVVVANIPNVTTVPFFTTVGYQIANDPNIPWSSLPLGFVYQKSGETGVGSGSATKENLASFSVLVTLKASSYATLLGQPTGIVYRGLGGLPAGIDTTQPFGFHPQNPFPNALVLDPDEINTSNTSVTEFNSVISTMATQFGFGLVDINTVFNSFVPGKIVDGISFSTAFVSGGLFSLDGVHPSNQAHAIIANEFIKAINTKWSASIPIINVATIPGSLYLKKSVTYKQGYPIIPIETFDHLLF